MEKVTILEINTMGKTIDKIIIGAGITPDDIGLYRVNKRTPLYNISDQSENAHDLYYSDGTNPAHFNTIKRLDVLDEYGYQVINKRDISNMLISLAPYMPNRSVGLLVKYIDCYQRDTHPKQSMFWGDYHGISSVPLLHVTKDQSIDWLFETTYPGIEQQTVLDIRLKFDIFIEQYIKPVYDACDMDHYMEIDVSGPFMCITTVNLYKRRYEYMTLETLPEIPSNISEFFVDD